MHDDYSVGTSGARAAYGCLLSCYKPSLGRDGKVGKLAQRVGVLHFGLSPPPNPMQGLFNMFKG